MGESGADAVGVAVVGYGYWGPNLLRNAYEVDGVRAVSVCELREDRLEAARERYPTVEGSRDYRELLKRDDVDAVVVATDLASHFEIARDALLADKHVLLGKPMTDDVEHGRELCRLADERDLVLMVDHTFLYTGAVREIRKLVRSGVLGRPLYFDSVRVNLGLVQPDHNVIWDLAPHDLSILLHIFDQTPTAVSAIGASHVDHTNESLETIGYLALRLPDNVLAHVHVNWLSPVKVRKTLIAGSDRMIVYDDLEPDEKVKVYDKGIELAQSRGEQAYEVLVQYRTGDIHIPKIDTTEALRTEMQHFRDCIREGREPVTSGWHGLDVVRILEAADASLQRRGEFVEL